MPFNILETMYGIISDFATQEFLSYWLVIKAERRKIVLFLFKVNL